MKPMEPRQTKPMQPAQQWTSRKPRNLAWFVNLIRIRESRTKAFIPEGAVNAPVHFIRTLLEKLAPFAILSLRCAKKVVDI